MRSPKGSPIFRGSGVAGTSSSGGTGDSGGSSGGVSGGGDNGSSTPQPIQSVAVAQAQLQTELAAMAAEVAAQEGFDPAEIVTNTINVVHQESGFGSTMFAVAAGVLVPELGAEEVLAEAAEGAVEATGASAEQLNGLADKVLDWLGEGSEIGDSSTSDLRMISEDGTRQIRFDITDPHGLDPHINLETFEPSYPGSGRMQRIDNEHIFLLP
jgi:hypothetical protein